MTPSVAEYMATAQREIEAVRESLHRDQGITPTSHRNREINGLDRALHALRNARTIENLKALDPPGENPPEGPKGPPGSSRAT